MSQVDAFFDNKVLLDELWPHIDAVFQWMLDWSDMDSSSHTLLHLHADVEYNTS